jgi:hypothetical protein
MATSTSDNAASAPGDEPRIVALASVAEQVAAIDALIPLARRRIRVFDADLSQMGWDHAGRIARLGAFLREGRGRRLDMIVHDTSWLERSCARLLDLQRAYSHAVTIYRTGAEARHASDPLVLVDDLHHLHRFHFEQPRAALAVNQPELTRPLALRYEEIWATGEPGINATVLGL